MLAAIEEPLLAARLVHRPRGGVRIDWLANDDPPPSYSDAALGFGNDLLQLLGRTPFSILEIAKARPWIEAIAAWRAVVGKLARDWSSLGPCLEALKPGILAEHAEAGEMELPLPSRIVLSNAGEPSVAAHRAETIARLGDFRIDPVAALGPGPGGGDDDPVEQVFYIPGEAPHRFLTKVGGLPFRMARWPWPTGRDGRPMTFVAQFNLATAADFVRDLPGDILLIFAERRENLIWMQTYQDGLTFEWWPLGLADHQLVAADQIPDTGWRIRPQFGVHLRTHDGRRLGSNTGTKIGGWPDFIQSGPYSGYFGGNHLIQFARPEPVPEGLDRWADLADPAVAGEAIKIGDGGCLYLFRRSDGTIDWYSECY